MFTQIEDQIIEILKDCLACERLSPPPGWCIPEDNIRRHPPQSVSELPAISFSPHRDGFQIDAITGMGAIPRVERREVREYVSGNGNRDFTLPSRPIERLLNVERLIRMNSWPPLPMASERGVALSIEAVHPDIARVQLEDDQGNSLYDSGQLDPPISRFKDVFEDLDSQRRYFARLDISSPTGISIRQSHPLPEGVPEDFQKGRDYKFRILDGAPTLSFNTPLDEGENNVLVRYVPDEADNVSITYEPLQFLLLYTIGIWVVPDDREKMNQTAEKIIGAMLDFRNGIWPGVDADYEILEVKPIGGRDFLRGRLSRRDVYHKELDYQIRSLFLIERKERTISEIPVRDFTRFSQYETQ